MPTKTTKIKEIDREDEKLSKYITNSNIYKMAQDFKTYVERNGKIPYRYVFDGVEFFGCEMQDIMTYTVLNLKSNCKADTPKWCSNANGDTINEKIYKDDFLDQARRVHDYIIKNKQIPNFVTTLKSKKRVDIDLFSYCIAKILVFYKNNGQLPNYCVYNTHDLKPTPTPTPSKKKYGHATEPCCDDRGQNTPYYCGPHALQEVIRNLTGIVVPQSTLAGWMGTTSSGSSHAGIETAVAKFNQKYGYNFKVQWKNFSEIGWNGIKNIVNSTNQDCLIHNWYRRGSSNGGGHYEVVNAINDTINVQNSLGSRCRNNCYYGYIEYRSKSTFEYYIQGISQKSVMVVTNA